jgi:membrane protein involved in colicin uptake
MAKLYQSEYDQIVSRRSGQDLNTLIMLLETDGTIEIAEDPTEDEIKAAREQAAKDAEKQQKEAEKEAEAAKKEADEQAAADAEAAETARVAAMPHPDDSGMDEITTSPPEGSDVASQKGEEVEDERTSTGRGKKS